MKKRISLRAIREINRKNKTTSIFFVFILSFLNKLVFVRNRTIPHYVIDIFLSYHYLTIVDSTSLMDNRLLDSAPSNCVIRYEFFYLPNSNSSTKIVFLYTQLFILFSRTVTINFTYQNIFST